MKKLAIILSAVVLVLLAWWLWGSTRSAIRSTNPYTLTVELSGTPGAPFTGQYIRDGKRVTVSGVLPWSLSESNVSRLEFRKSKAEDTLILDARGGGSTLSGRANPGIRGVKVEMEGGWRFETIR